MVYKEEKPLVSEASLKPLPPEENLTMYREGKSSVPGASLKRHEPLEDFPQQYFKKGKFFADHVQEGWENFLSVNSCLMQGMSSCNMKNAFSSHTGVILYPEPPNQGARVRVRYRNRDIGRLLREFAEPLAGLLWRDSVRVNATIIPESPDLRFGQEMLLEARIFVHKSLFSDQARLYKRNEVASYDVEQFYKLLVGLRLVTPPQQECSDPERPRPPITSGVHVELSDEEKSLAEHIPGLTCSLRPYQKKGVAWMVASERKLSIAASSDNYMWEEIRNLDTTIYRHVHTGEISLTKQALSTPFRGGILADEMGLGKTIQTIATILKNPPVDVSKSEVECLRGNTLVVCPASVLFQWIEEVEAHSENLRAIAFYGAQRHLINANELNADFTDVVVTTYTILNVECRQDPNSRLFQMKWHRIVLDEAHNIRGRSSVTARAAWNLNSVSKWALTGTPIQNHPNDLYSVLKFLGVNPWQDFRFWNEKILRKYTSGDKDRQIEAEELIRTLLTPLMLRRCKSSRDENGDLILEPMELKSRVLKVDPDEKERDFYNALYKQTRTTFDGFVAQNTVLSNYASVLELLLRLRQCCNHPLLVLKRHDLSKELRQTARRYMQSTEKSSADSLKYVENVLEDLRNSNSPARECPICLESVDDPVMSKCAHSACRECFQACFRSRQFAKCPVCRTSLSRSELFDIPSASEFDVDLESMWKPSKKVEMLLADLAKIRSSRRKEKALVFSQWTKMLDLLEIPLRRENFSFVRLDGQTPPCRRPELLEEFATGATDLMLISLKAGGVGLNLTAANHVFLMDPWWNPAVEEQAIGRAHRIGQTKTVIVTRYIVSNTVEEKLLAIQEKKRNLVEGTIEDSAIQDKQSRLDDIKYLFS